MRQQIEILNDLNYIKNHQVEVCIFGCGNIGKGAGYDILNFLGIRVANYSDNDTSKWGKLIRNGIQCISPELISHNNNIVYGW